MRICTTALQLLRSAFRLCKTASRTLRGLHSISWKLSSSCTVVEKYFDRAAINRLARWTWPGNVRELRTMVERLVVLGRRHAYQQHWSKPPLPVRLIR